MRSLLVVLSFVPVYFALKSSQETLRFFLFTTIAYIFCRMGWSLYGAVLMVIFIFAASFCDLYSSSIILSFILPLSAFFAMALIIVAGYNRLLRSIGRPEPIGDSQIGSYDDCSDIDAGGDGVDDI